MIFVKEITIMTWNSSLLCFLISPLKVMSFIILYLKALGKFLDCLLDGSKSILHTHKWGLSERARM